MKFVLTLLLCSASIPLSALNVNRLNGSVNLLYIDFSIPGPVLPVELARAYNSITAMNEKTGWNGAFGWGWTSLSESILTLTGERKVLLRDGLSGNTLTFAVEKEDPSVRSEFMKSVKRAFFQQRMKRTISDAELSKLTLPTRMEADIANDPEYRARIAAQFNITSPLPRGEAMVSSEYGYQTVEYRNNMWIREHDGVTQAYDKEGRIVRQTDKNNFTIFFTYSSQEKNQTASIESEDKSVRIKFTWRKNRIIEAIDNRSLHSNYTYDEMGNLVKITDSANQTFVYRYENKQLPHLITGIDYVNESQNGSKVTREIRYNDSGLVVFSREKDGTETQYTYGKSTSDPQDRFWTKYVTKFPSGKTDDEFDDYTIKTQPNGIRYLYRQETKKNGNITASQFNSSGGKPVQVVENGVATDYKYYPNGLLMEKTGPKESLKLEYDPRFRKISKITQNGITSIFKYDTKGNITSATNSRNEAVTLGYDRFGRIIEMQSKPRSKLSFRYGNQGKPILIVDKGVGTIRITYAPNGKIVRTETVAPQIRGRIPSQKSPQEIIRAVMTGFQNLLNIIRPAGVQFPVG